MVTREEVQARSRESLLRTALSAYQCTKGVITNGDTYYRRRQKRERIESFTHQQLADFVCGFYFGFKSATQIELNSLVNKRG